MGKAYARYLEQIESDLARAVERHWITLEEQRKYHAMVMRLVDKPELSPEEKSKALLGLNVIFSDLRGL
ncbi:hypothetical protein HY572_00920 [Candidatus Micrarchaeota archaeon]|nr:hypothetical protein [Candidatus Micrarchaeota archaeon]